MHVLIHRTYRYTRLSCSCVTRRVLLGVAQPEQEGAVPGLERAAGLRGGRDGPPSGEQVGRRAQGKH